MRLPARSTMTAMLCAAAVTAQFISGKATRDALFLTSIGPAALPAMLVATAACSLLLVAGYTRLGSRVSPQRLVPASFIASGVLFVVQWLMSAVAPPTTAVLLYLHVSGAGPLLASGFWLVATERLDPRTARRRLGPIAGAGTLGGLVGAVLSANLAAGLGVPTMMLVLAGFQFLTAWLVRLLARQGQSAEPTSVHEPVRTESRSGLRVVAETPQLRHLALLVLLGTTSAALLEYLFKLRAVETLGPGDHLLRFFALYYGATSLITFVLQTWWSRAALERFGLGLTASTPSIALLAGGLGSVLVPGFASIVVARAGESIFRGSWFRAGYELFYTPISASEKRAAKSVVDVGFDRLGDAVGGGLVRIAVAVAPVAASSAILLMAMASSAGAIVVASRLNHWYVRTLGDSLVARGGPVVPDEAEDDSTRQVLSRLQRGRADSLPQTEVAASGPLGLTSADLELRDIAALRSPNLPRAISVLTRDEGLSAGLVAHAIPLLASTSLEDYAFFALRKVAEERVGQLTDALLDPNQDDVVRRRLARVFSGCVSQRAADGLVRALDDRRFDVRFQAARSLAAVLDRNPRVQVGHDVIFEVVRREVAVGRPVWESRRLLAGVVSESPLDEFVRDRAGQSLAHVFTLLSLVLPGEPLQIAFRSLHAEDRQLRGTALEYLEEVLPAPIRDGLWPFLEKRRPESPAQPHEEIIAQLLRSSHSLTLSALAHGMAESSEGGARSVRQTHVSARNAADGRVAVSADGRVAVSADGRVAVSAAS